MSGRNKSIQRLLRDRSPDVDSSDPEQSEYRLVSLPSPHFLSHGHLSWRLAPHDLTCEFLFLNLERKSLFQAPHVYKNAITIRGVGPFPGWSKFYGTMYGAYCPLLVTNFLYRTLIVEKFGKRLSLASEASLQTTVSEELQKRPRWFRSAHVHQRVSVVIHLR